MPTGLLTEQEQRVSPPLQTASVPTAARNDSRRVRRLRLNAAAWGIGTILATTLWVVNEWRANGAFERFGHEGDPGQWNPTLWAVVVGLWGLVVGLMALGVYFAGPSAAFHAAAWLFGVGVLAPLWALIEWQDNGSFERWSTNSNPGDWDPWILTVGAIWAVAAAAHVLWTRRKELRG